MPLAVMLVGLDSRFSRFGVAANEFFAWFHSNRLDGSRQLTETGAVSCEKVSACKASSGPARPTSSPSHVECTHADGIDLNMLESDSLTSIARSWSASANKIETTVHIVEDNMAYYNKLVDAANVNVLYPLSQYGLTRTIKRTEVTAFASLNKILNGSPHDHHSHLLQWDMKAIGFKLNLGKDGYQTKQVVDDMAK